MPNLTLMVGEVGSRLRVRIGISVGGFGWGWPLGPHRLTPGRVPSPKRSGSGRRLPSVGGSSERAGSEAGRPWLGLGLGLG